MQQRQDHAGQRLLPRYHFRCAVRWLCMLVLFGGIFLHSRGTAQPLRFEIGLIGDLPYTAEDDAKFPHLMQAMNEANLAFVVHVGDIEHDPRGYKVNKTGTMPCTDEAFAQRKALFHTSTHPFILTPGDNDWTDCRYAEPSLDPLERLTKLRAVFFQGDQSFGQRTLPLTRQSTDPQYATFRENVRWTYGEVLFVTLHIVGSNNNLGYTPENDAEYAARTAANLVWLKQAFELAKRNAHKGIMILTQANPYFEDHWGERRQRSLHIAPSDPKPTGYGDILKALEAEVLAFDKPVALVQGDTHYFRIDKPLFSTTKQRMIEHFTRVEVFGTPNVHWVRGIIDANDPQVFTFKPEIVQKNLVNHGPQ
jgi:hypothetical protein